MTTVTKEEKKGYTETYFGNCKPKELKEIIFETPQGHNVEALICTKHNRYLGSLLILEVDGENTEQFVQGMPKIHYLDNYHMIKTGSPYDYYDVYEKLDGTNICLYGLKDAKGEVIEIVPKSRNRGTLDPQFHQLYDQLDKRVFEEHIMENQDFVLYFELYGMGNLHTVKHLDTWLDLKFLGAYDGKEFIKQHDFSLANHCRPNRLFRIFNIQSSNTEGYNFYVSCDSINLIYKGHTNEVGKRCKNMEECVEYMKDVMEGLNREYDKHNHRIALEGAVINGVDYEDRFVFIKVKPHTIELAHKSENGIPKQFIMKEIMKYLDEYRSEAKENWENNQDEVMEYINDNLSESFEREYIDKSQKKIKELFEKKITPQPLSEEIMAIGDKLMEEHPNESITDLMRIFGSEYPHLKKSGGRLHRYLGEKLQ